MYVIAKPNDIDTVNKNATSTRWTIPNIIIQILFMALTFQYAMSNWFVSISIYANNSITKYAFCILQEANEYYNKFYRWIIKENSRTEENCFLKIAKNGASQLQA